MTPADLALVRSDPVPIPTAPREPLRSAAWIAANVFDNERGARWVLKHCPRVQLTAVVVRFHESRVREWIATCYRNGAA